MQPYVHLHVHTQYSVLDGQAAIPALVDKALADGMKAMAITDHGNMMGIKEFANYVNKVKGKAKGALKAAEERLTALADGTFKPEAGTPEAEMSHDELVAAAQKAVAKNQAVVDFMPIYGCEMYVARRGDKTLHEIKADQSGWHLVVLAKNSTGYHNLVKLVSRAWVDGFYMRPRTDHADLERFHEGLIVCSACLGGEVPQKLIGGNYDEARDAVLWFKRVFGEDYYLEMQRHEVTNPHIRANRETYPIQQKVNAQIMRLAAETGVKLVCTNDCHFVDEVHGEAHDRLICLSTGKDLDDPTRMLYTKQEWFKTQAEMNAVFADCPEALATTIEIASKVEAYTIDHGPIMPNFDIPAEFGTEADYRKRYTDEDIFQEFTRDENGREVLSREEAESKIKKLGGIDKLYRIKLEADYLGLLAYQGAERRYGTPLSDEVKERINFELHIMKTMGFPGYFLIVQDYIRAAREQLDVSVGPGRGSAAGSAVAYCLGITQIDPIKYDLLFERFLNPDRISLPDIDVDFDDDGRGRVLAWVTEKYHAENCAHIITYGTMATRSAIKDVARVQKLPRDITDRICAAIPDKLPEGPDGKTPKMNLKNAIAAIPLLAQAEVSPDPLLHDTIRYAKMLEGNVRNTGVHACGFIICRDPISDWVPVSTALDKETNQKVACTQYEGKVIEETGLIKMDFLGLKTLSIIREAIQNIRESLGVVVDIDHIDINDPATYQLYCDGNTVGTFQFESVGMQRYLTELRPSTFEDLIAMNALYRPGPMQYIPQFIRRKHGIDPITYDLPCMEKYLKDTYGITVYQEQVMLLSREIAGFTRGESDALRKAMGKKLIDKLNHMYPKFIEGGKARGHDPKILEKIWEDWRAFASYAFNKSHATCYSWVAYQTAYLKANYPAQYMAGVMSRSKDDIKTITKLMDESRRLGINTLGPDINESRVKFSVNHTSDIRFGLGAIKGVGDSAVEAILSERSRGGDFKDIYDFVERVNLSAVGKKCIESLALAGAFDSLSPLRREQYVEPSASGVSFIDQLVRFGQTYQTDRAQASASLFGEMAEAIITRPQADASIREWSAMQRLTAEKEMVGVFISGHPLDEYAIVINDVCTLHAADLADLTPFGGREVTLGGIAGIEREGQTKKGLPYGIVRIEDFSGSGSFSLFGDDWARWRGYFAGDNFVYVNARVEPRRWDPSSFDLRVGAVSFLSDVKDRLVTRLTIGIYLSEATESDLAELSETLSAAALTSSEGGAAVRFCLLSTRESRPLSLKSTSHRVSVDKRLVDYLSEKSCFTYRIN